MSWIMRWIRSVGTKPSARFKEQAAARNTQERVIMQEVKGPPYGWNYAGWYGQPRYQPTDWKQKGPDFDRKLYKETYGKKA